MKRVLVFLGLLLMLPCARAGVRPLNLHQLCEGATRIVHGHVTGSTVRWAGNMIVTDWVVAPVTNLKGSGSEPFEVRVPGGTIGNVTMHASEAPKMAAGEEVVLFLRPGAASCDVYGWFQGKYTVFDGNVREQKDTSLATFLKSIETELGR